MGVLIGRGIGEDVLGGLLKPGRGTVVLGGTEAGVATGDSSSLSDSNVRSTTLLRQSLRMLAAAEVLEGTVRRDKSGHPGL
jgi:hypothetical protein